MAGNTTSLYSTSSSNGTTGSNNFTTLYPSTQGVLVPTTPYGNANVVALLNAGTDGSNIVANIKATGNITGNYFIGNGSQLTGLPASYSNANVVTLLANFGSNTISTTGNISGGYILGNGSQLTGLPATYGNAQVSAYLSSGTVSSNIITTANVTGGFLTTTGASGNIQGVNYVSANYFVGNGSLLTGITAASSNTAVTVTGNAQPNITSVGILSSLSSSGNITGAYIIGNGSQLSGLPAGYSNANVATFLANFGSNTISTTGNVTAGYFVGNASLLSSITGANVTGTVANAAYATLSGSATTADSANTAVTVTGNAQANITSVGTLTSVNVSGNVVGGNILTAGVVSATGNVTGNYFIGNGSQLTGISATSNAAGSNTQIQYNNAGAFAGSANLTFDNTTNTLSTTTVTATANINGATLSITGNTTGANIFSYPTANGAIVNSTQASNVNALVNPYRIVYGNGFRGDYGVNADPASFNRGSQLAVIGTQVLANADATNTSRLMTSSYFMDLAQGANITNTNKRYSAGGFYSQIGNGNITLTAAAGTNMGAILNGGTQTLLIGNSANANLGAVSVSHAAALNSTLIASTGGTVGNATGALVTLQTGAANASFTTSQIGYTAQFLGTTGTPAGNVIGYYMPSNVTTNYGFNSTNLNRAATNYYFLKNDDTVAQSQLGSLRSYNEFRYDTATSGSIAIDKNNAQVQYIAPTANVTITGYSNMVTSLSDSVNNDQEIDTLTILVQQGATPYTVTLPTGATYQYAGNISTVPAVANSRSILTVVAANIAGTVNYFTTVTSDQPASAGGSPGGANTQIQYNNASAFGGAANLTFNTATGNVNLGNLIFTTSNATNYINTVAPFTGIPANVTAFSNSQIVIGSGFNGNTNLSLLAANGPKGGRLVIYDTLAVADSGGPRTSALGIAPILSLTGNISNTNTFLRGVAAAAIIGGGTSNYQVQYPSLNTVQGGSFALLVGQPNTVAAYGNTNVYSGVGLAAQATVQNGSTAGNLVGLLSTTTATGVANNVAGLLLQLQGNPASSGNPVPANVYGIYMNSANSQGIFGQTVNTGVNTEQMRSATNYYFLRNDDDLAQVKLGSLRLFNEFRYDGANTSGTLAVNKLNGQVQNVYLTGAVTSVTFSNFVTQASQSYTPATKYQTDTVTLIIHQGSTPYAVTMPTGTAYKYAAGTTTVGTTANAVTMISVTATYDSITAADQYLITISPEFV